MGLSIFELAQLSKGQAEILGSATVSRQISEQSRESQEEMTSYQDSDVEKVNFPERD